MSSSVELQEINKKTSQNSRKISGEQVEYKMKNAQDILKTLQFVLKDGEIPPTKVINDVLFKAECFLFRQAQNTESDSETRKCMEDIALMVSSAKKMAKEKDLGDRLQRIGEETAKAMIEVNEPGLSDEAREQTIEIVNLVENWRPLFQLFISSKEFRSLIIDIVRILRKFLLRPKHDNVETTGTTVISDEEFDVLYQDLVAILAKLAKTPSFRDGLDKMFNLFDILKSQLSFPTPYIFKHLHPHAQKAQEETTELIASFTGHESLDNFMASLKKFVGKLYGERTTRTKTRQFQTELRHFIFDTEETEKLNAKESKERIKTLVKEGRDLIELEQIQDELHDVFDKSDQIVESIKNDEYVAVLKQHADAVVKDLSYVDNDGKLKLDFNMLGKLREIIVPVLVDTFKYIPIPKIEDDDENRHFWVDNIVLCGYDVIPDNILIHMESDTEIHIRDNHTDQSRTRLNITLNNIRTELKNLDFYYHKKSFPQLKEHGKATLSLPRDGANLVITYYVRQSENVVKFQRGKVFFQIHDFELEFEKNTLSHDILVPMFTSMFKDQLRKQIEQSVEKNIGDLVNNIGSKLTTAIVETQSPLKIGMDMLKKAVSTTEVESVILQRKEILE